jgi:Zn-dependent protease
MFIEYASTDLPYFISVVVTVIVSIILHELAHGVVAVRLGDETPRELGHLTLNPLVHMPPFAIVTLLLAGIAWGSMPINPSRLRGRFGEALVSLAGPATNLLLAAIALTTLALWQRATPPDPDPARQVMNTWEFLRVFGTINLALCVFNLLPVPPLDGSHILANFNRGYRNFINDPNSQSLAVGLFIGAFILSRYLFRFTGRVATDYIDLLNGQVWTFG